jgi:serine phosphatase RsbU (regulator of sigma subunit)
LLLYSILTQISPDFPFYLSSFFYFIISPLNLILSIKAKKRDYIFWIAILNGFYFLLNLFFFLKLGSIFYLILGISTVPNYLIGKWIRIEFVNNQKTINKLNRDFKSQMMDMDLARNIQESLFPTSFQIKGIKFLEYRKSFHKLGGDFYDFVRLREENIGIFLTDVSGHGIPASMIAAMIKVIVSNIPYSLKINPSSFLTFLDKKMSTDFPTHHASAIYVFINFHGKKMTIANAGHPYILFSPKGQDYFEIQTEGSILGYSIKNPIASNLEIKFKKGDRFVLYTDGISDLTDLSDKPLDSDGLLRILNDTNNANNLEEFKEKVVYKIKNFNPKKDFSDDAMILFCEFE